MCVFEIRLNMRLFIYSFDMKYDQIITFIKFGEGSTRLLRFFPSVLFYMFRRNPHNQRNRKAKNKNRP